MTRRVRYLLGLVILLATATVGSTLVIPFPDPLLRYGLLALGLVVGALLMPAPRGRQVTAIIVGLVTLAASWWLNIGYTALPLGQAQFWSEVHATVPVFLIGSIAVWLILRARRPLAWVVLAGPFLLPFAVPLLAPFGLLAGFIGLALLPLLLVVLAWIAAGIDRAVRAGRRR